MFHDELSSYGTESKSGDGWLIVCYYPDDRGVDAHFLNYDNEQTSLEHYLEILGE
jgi:hypothetical protein